MLQTKTTRINDQLIKEHGDHTQFALIRVLNLRGLKIVKIQNLDSLSSLEELNLSHNSITVMENLSKLLSLRELNLSDNYIRQVQGIDSLQKLQTLNLNGNQITEIEINNQAIETLKLSRNQIKDAGQLANLRVLVNLKTLSISDNPFCRSYTYTELLCFLSPSLQVVDNKAIKPEQIENAKVLFGAGVPSDQQQLQQNIRLAQQSKQEVEQEIIQLEHKIQKAINLLKTYKDISDSDEEVDQQIAQKTLNVLQNQLEECLQKKEETEELLIQLQAQLDQFKVKPKQQYPTEQLNRINSLFIRLQAVLQVDFTLQQRGVFEAALQGNVQNMLSSFYDILEVILQRIPYLPHEHVLQEASEQLHKQIKDFYSKVAVTKIPVLDKDNYIENSIILLKKLFKRAEKKYKKIDEFNNIKSQFLKDFDAETKELAERWRDYEYRKQQLLDEKEAISKDLEEQMSQLIEQKEDLKRQHQEMQFYFQKSDQDFVDFRQKQEEAKQLLQEEIEQLAEDRDALASQVQDLKIEADKLRDVNAEREESIRLLNEEIEMLQQRIQENYQLNFQIREEQQQAISNIEYLTNQKLKMNKELEELHFEIDTRESQQKELAGKFQADQNRFKKQLDELDLAHKKLVDTEKLCREAEKILKELNLAIKDKEDDLVKYEKIMSEANIEKERNKQLKQENQQMKRENTKLRQELDSQQAQSNQLQENVNQAKKNLAQVQQMTSEKEQELVSIEKELINLEKQVQDTQKQKDQASSDYDAILKEIKKVNLEKIKLTQQVDDATIDLQSLKQECNIQQQSLQSLNKQIDMKVTELSTATHFHRNEVGQTENQMQNLHSQLLKLREQCDSKGYEFKQLVDQIESLVSKRDTLVKEVYGLQQQVLNSEGQKQLKESAQLPRPYIIHDEDSAQSQSYEKLKSEWFKPPAKRHLQAYSQTQLSDYPRIIKPRSANQSLTGQFRRSPIKDQSMQSVIQNIEEVNQNLDRMYLESVERQGM